MTPTTVSFAAVWTGDGFRHHPTYRIHDDHVEPVSSVHEQAGRPGEPGHAGEPGDARDTVELGGTLFPRLTDHHVHLGLIDAATLVDGGITNAIDLGWDPAVASTWLHDDPHRPHIAIAGALLTAPGGYPTRAGWAPPGAAREVGGPRQGREAVREQVMAGASRIKVALNSDAGTTVDDATLHAIVEEAAHAGLPVVAHAQGTGQAERAVYAGVDQFAHTPFSDRLPDAVVAEAVRRGMSWISTLDIHGWGTPSAQHGIALDNLRRFHSAGGRVLYGTDLGNGPLPVGVNARELAGLLAAGLDATALVRAIAGDAETSTDGDADADTGAGTSTGTSLSAARSVGPRFAWTPGAPPEDPALLPGWLALARGLRPSDLAAALPATTTTTTATTTTEGQHR